MVWILQGYNVNHYRPRSVKVYFWRRRQNFQTCTLSVAISSKVIILRHNKHFRMFRSIAFIWCASHTNQINYTETRKQNVKGLSFLPPFIYGLLSFPLCLTFSFISLKVLVTQICFSSESWYQELSNKGYNIAVR